MEGLSHRDMLPRVSCGCGKGVVVVVCLYSMYVPRRNGDGFEDDVHGGAVPQGYVTPAPPVGVGRAGKGVVVVVCLYSMYVPPRNSDGFEDDVHGGAVPQRYVTPAPAWVWEGVCGGSMFVFYVCTRP